jgi:hypothetical protein
MIVDLALIGTILAILGFFGYRETQHAKEKHDLMLAAMSHSVDEYLDIKTVDRSLDKKPEVPVPSPVVMMDELDDEEFFKRILNPESKDKN